MPPLPHPGPWCSAAGWRRPPALALQVFQVEARKGQVLARLLAMDSFLTSVPCVAQALLPCPSSTGRLEPEGILLTHPLYPPGDGRPAGVSWVAVSQCMGSWPGKVCLQSGRASCSPGHRRAGALSGQGRLMGPGPCGSPLAAAIPPLRFNVTFRCISAAPA